VFECSAVLKVLVPVQGLEPPLVKVKHEVLENRTTFRFATSTSACGSTSWSKIRAEDDPTATREKDLLLDQSGQRNRRLSGQRFASIEGGARL
jgi:hypothetical protein